MCRVPMMGEATDLAVRKAGDRRFRAGGKAGGGPGHGAAGPPREGFVGVRMGVGAQDANAGLTRFCAMGPPMVPSPMNPTLSLMGSDVARSIGGINRQPGGVPRCQRTLP